MRRDSAPNSSGVTTGSGRGSSSKKTPPGVVFASAILSSRVIANLISLFRCDDPKRFRPPGHAMEAGILKPLDDSLGDHASGRAVEVANVVEQPPTALQDTKELSVELPAIQL